MFESVERGERIDDETFERRAAALRVQLLACQYEALRAAEFPILVLVNGVDGAGKSETVSALSEWMDPRHVQAHAMGEPTDEESQRPPMWRFWRRLPPRGKTGVFFGNWYTRPIIERALGRAKRDTYLLEVDEIRRLEQMLVAEGAVLVKLWFHLSKKSQKKRLHALASRKRTAWRVTEEEWDHFARYDDFRAVSEETLRATDVPAAPWTLIDGTDVKHAALTAGEALLAAVTSRLATRAAKAEPAATLPKAKKSAAKKPARKARAGARALDVEAAHQQALRGDVVPIVRTLDLSRSLDRSTYEKRMDKLQRELALLTRHKRFHRCSPMFVFEGVDAAGKGGAIRRLTHAIDPRLYQIVPIAAPTDEERAQPYLWRFWRHAPRDGKVVIFDRSWYGRVLVERVEGFCSDADWQRAYGEINDFEAQLVRAGAVIAKFWLQVSPEEQLRRFREREQVEFKRFKITAEDWRNRDKWPLYEVAASDMVVRTSTELAPWTLVEAEDKRYARVKVLDAAVRALEAAL